SLQKITGRRTVPNVLVSGTSIGGGADVEALHQPGELIAKIKELGGKRIVEAKVLDSKLRRGLGGDRR
ncbi:MAG: hypothetical protein MMC23_009194, partial [Stictis urceolatum]|nr:hypothetical protein [Stictis urceolata]